MLCALASRALNSKQFDIYNFFFTQKCRPHTHTTHRLYTKETENTQFFLVSLFGLESFTIYQIKTRKDDPIHGLLIEFDSLEVVWTNGTDSSSSSSSRVDVVVLPLVFTEFKLMWLRWSILLAFDESLSSSSIDGVRCNLMIGRSPFDMTNDAGRALLANCVTFDDELVCGNCADDCWDCDCCWTCDWNDIDGRFSLKYSTTTGWFCLIDTRRSVFFMLPECFKMESRRAIIGELAKDGHALIDGNVNSLRSAMKWEKKRKTNEK